MSYNNKQPNKISIPWISARIRPYGIIYTLSLFGIIMIWDSLSSKFIVPEHYVTILGTIISIQVTWYYTGRTVEKIKGISHESNEGK